jgi:hypothetical protein
MKGTAMESISQIISFAGAMFERLPQQMAPIESVALAASVIVLSVLATAPRRPAEIFGAVALAMLGVLVFFAPNYTMVLFAIACGSVGIARSRHRSAVMQKQLDKMRHAIQQLELAENRRLLQSLNSASPSVDRVQQQDAPSIMPSDHIDDAVHSTEPHVVN